MRRLLLLLFCLSAVLATSAGSALADITSGTPETLHLDTHLGTSPLAGPVSTTGILTNGTYYVAVVSGTYSAFVPGLWDGSIKPWHVCGTPESSPMTPSPGQPASPAGQDAETAWARPWRTSCANVTPYPHHEGHLLINPGTGFGKIVPIGGPYSAPTSGHTYTYLMQGVGAIASFELQDTQIKDNNGILTIVVRPATPSECAGLPGCASPPPGTTPPGGGTGTSTGTGQSQSGVCVSRRKFRIRIPSRRANPVVSAIMQLNGKPLASRRVKIEKTSRVIAVVDLRGLKTKRTSVLKIIARLRSGARQFQTRIYHTCTSKRLTKLTITPKRDRTAPFRFHVVGRITKPQNAPRNACSGGRVVVAVGVGNTSLASRTVRLTSSCRFSFTQTVKVPARLRGKLLTYRARFLGTKSIDPSSAWPVTVKAG